jgi:hypothetical protein
MEKGSLDSLSISWMNRVHHCRHTQWLSWTHRQNFSPNIYSSETHETIDKTSITTPTLKERERLVNGFRHQRNPWHLSNYPITLMFFPPKLTDTRQDKATQRPTS